MAATHFGVRPKKINTASGVLTGTSFTTGVLETCMGWSIRNTSATHTLTITLSGTKTVGGTKSATTTAVIAEIVLPKSAATPAADVSVTQWLGPQGVKVYGAIYVTKSGTGTPAGSVYIG